MSGILSIGNFSATSGLNSLGDASVNGRLFVGADASFGGNITAKSGNITASGTVSSNALTINNDLTYAQLTSIPTYFSLSNWSSNTYTFNGITFTGFSTAVNNTGSFIMLLLYTQSGTYTSANIVYSKDFGATWSNGTFPGTNITYLSFIVQFQVYGTQYAFLGLRYDNVSYRQYAGTYITTDAGQTWTAWMANGQTVMPQFPWNTGYLAFTNGQPQWNAGNLYFTDDAKFGLWTSRYTALASTDYGATWNQISLPNPSYGSPGIYNYYASSKSGQYLLAGYYSPSGNGGNYQGSVLLSTNYGSTFVTISNVNMTRSTNYPFANSISSAAGTPYSNGGTWTVTGVAMNSTGQVMAVGLYYTNYLATPANSVQDGSGNAISGLAISTNYGTSFTYIPRSNFPNISLTTNVSLLSLNDVFILVNDNTSAYYYISYDNGTTWSTTQGVSAWTTNTTATYRNCLFSITGSTSNSITYSINKFTYGNSTAVYMSKSYLGLGTTNPSYILDVSGAPRFSGQSFFQTDVSINNRLYVGSDVSFGGRLFSAGDASLNGNVSIASDLNINGNMYVRAYTTRQMITELSYQLIIAEDISVNGRLFLSNDASINGRLFVGADVSMGGKLFTVGDTSHNARLYVGSDASFGTRVFIAGDLSVNGNVNINGNLTAVTQTSTDNSTKVATTAYVKTALGSVGASSYFATDVSMAARLYVTSDVSFNGNAYIGKNLILGVSGQYSPFNLDVSGSVNLSGAVQGVLTLPDGSHMISNNEPLDFSNNFCTTLGPQITVSANTISAIMMSATGQYQTAPTTTAGIHTSSNFGASWTLNASAPTSGWGPMGSCAMSANGQYQYALSKGSGYIYFSSDYGATWAQFSTPPIAGAQYYGLIAVSANNRFITVVVGNSSSGTGTASPYLLIPSVSAPTVYVSQNYGATWNTLNPGFSGSIACSLAMSANGQYQTITGNNNYLFISKNYGTSWITTNNTGQFLVSISATGQYIYYTAGNGGPYISNNYGQSFTNCTWTGVTGYTGSDFVLLSSTGQYVIVIYANGNFFTSVNYGQTWKNLGYGYLSGAAMSANGKYVTLTWGGIVYTMTVPNVNNFQTIGKFISAGDATIGSRLFITSDASFSGKLYVASTLTKGGGSFDIAHPDPSKPIGSRLRHCFVEAPTRGDNIYRFKVSTVNSSASVELPSYYKFLNEDTQIWVNAVNCLGTGYGTLASDSETVNVTVSQDGDYNVLIIGTRKDQMMIDFFDNNGGAEYYVGNKNEDVSGN